MTHEPVMVQETLAALNLKVGDVVVDGTLGLGGHATHFLEAVQPLGTLLGFDWTNPCSTRLPNGSGKKYGSEFRAFNSDYRAIPATMKELGLQPNAIFLILD